VGEDNGNGEKGQIAKVLERLTGTGSSINIFFLDLGPEMRQEIRDLKEALKDLAQVNLDRTVTKQIVRNAFSMGKAEVLPPVLPMPEPPTADGRVLTPAERRLLTRRNYLKLDLIEVLAMHGWDRRKVATKYNRSFVSIGHAIRRFGIEPPGGK
jgi:hypothetical protein